MEQMLLDLSKFFHYSLEKPWFFTEYGFLLTLALFLLGYAFFKPKSTWKLAYLIVFSLFFYYKSSGPFLLLFVGVITFDYILALWIYRLEGIKRKIAIGLTVVYSLSFLLYFKYSNFVIENLNTLFGTDFSQKNLFLPIGISFYTFQSVSYLIDVYRKEIKPSKQLLEYGFYMTFFPHLVAGPIVRAKDFLPQIQNPISFNPLLLKEALLRIVTGLLKKLLIADFLGKYVDMIHQTPQGFSGLEHTLSMYAYSFQIYFDFSGYSDIAIGIALILGYRMKENFFNPYTAQNIVDFWRKWHISLSLWLRDYIYIPLGGNRKGQLKMYLFLFITMTVGGIWHGADWRFVFWGCAHGLLLILNKLWFKPVAKPKSIQRIVGIILTFHLVGFLWIFFRAATIESAFQSITIIATRTNPMDILAFAYARPEVIALLLVSITLVFMPWNLKQKVIHSILSLPLSLWPIILLIALQLIVQFRDSNIEPFIYFQF